MKSLARLWRCPVKQKNLPRYSQRERLQTKNDYSMTSQIIAQMAQIHHQIKLIDGETDYYICADGAVLSMKHGKLRALKPWLTGAGYLQVSIGGRKKYVHRLLLLTFGPPLPTPDHVVDHIDFDRQNNDLANLRWLGRVANMRRTPASLLNTLH